MLRGRAYQTIERTAKSPPKPTRIADNLKRFGGASLVPSVEQWLEEERPLTELAGWRSRAKPL